MYQNAKAKDIREAVTFLNEGQKIFGVLHRPLEVKEKIPGVIICCGLAGSKCGKFRIFVRLAEKLAEKGIATLRFDYRGSGDSEGDFSEITIENEVSDTLAALDFFSKASGIDSKRLGILGRSLGGAIAILATRRFQRIKSIALWAPVFKSDPWRELWNSYLAMASGQSPKSILSIPTHLPNVPNVNFLKQFFSLNMQEELKSLEHLPLLHIHGHQDAVVKMEHARDYKDARNETTKSRFVELLKSDHDFSDFEEQEIALNETVKWFLETL